MDVRLSSEQQALRDSVALVVDRLGPQVVGQLDDPERAAKLDAAVVAAGWRDLRTGNDGAPWASAVEAAIIAEELGRGLADTSFLGPTLAAEFRRLAGVPPSGSKETIVLVCDLSSPACADDGVLPRGAVGIDAAGSGSALVLVPAPEGHQLAEVALPEARSRIDLTRPSFTFGSAVETVPIGEAAWLLTTGDLTRWTALGLALTCADLVGVMRGAVRLACDYARDRRQYGTAIGSFQAIQHLLADAHVSMEGSRSVALHAAWAVDTLAAPEALAAAAVAKAYCARAARTVCETAIQVHGGIGNTWECLAHVYLRRALLSSDVLGGVGANLSRALAHHAIGGSHGLR